MPTTSCCHPLHRQQTVAAAAAADDSEQNKPASVGALACAAAQRPPCGVLEGALRAAQILGLPGVLASWHQQQWHTGLCRTAGAPQHDLKPILQALSHASALCWALQALCGCVSPPNTLRQAARLAVVEPVWLWLTCMHPMLLHAPPPTPTLVAVNSTRCCDASPPALTRCPAAVRRWRAGVCCRW